MRSHTEVQVVEEDLDLLNMRLLGRPETCPCRECREFDTSMGVDLIVRDADGLRKLVAYRRQGTVSFNTITVRLRTDLGSTDSEARKLVDGELRADVHLQSYQDAVLWIPGEDLRSAVMGLHYRFYPECRFHPKGRHGSGGQIFLIVCPNCTSAQRVPRRNVVGRMEAIL